MSLRQIKSYVLRQGKITLGQQRAVAELMPKYGIAYDAQPLDLNAAFGRDNPKVVEIGFGMGQATWQIAQANPDYDYLGIEMHWPGVGSLLLQAQAQEVTNLKVIRHDAVAVIRDMLPAASLHGVHIFFPDPWPKTRHHKRRLLQSDFIHLIVSKLQRDGYLHLATDWEDYAWWMLAKLQAEPELRNAATDFVLRPATRPLTKFEQRGLTRGHQVWDLIFYKSCS